MRKKIEDKEKEQQEQSKIALMIQQHNTSLQQKALANSFLKKMETNSSKLSPDDESISIIKKPQPVNANTASNMNSTFTCSKEKPQKYVTFNKFFTT